MRNTVSIGDCLAILKTFPENSVHCCVTSPPYFGLRDYGIEGQIGLEPTPQEYVDKLVEVFREVKRVLHPTGTLWLNLGDSYVAKPYLADNPQGLSKHPDQGTQVKQSPIGLLHNRKDALQSVGLKPKDLIGIPWRVVFALQADGWWLRSDIIWAKGNCMPESVVDRPTTSHEHIFLLAKSPRYFYDQDAIREPHTSDAPVTPWQEKVYDQSILPETHRQAHGKKGRPHGVAGFGEGGRNKRSVWNINPKPYPEAHFATFPEEIPETCIKAGTSEKGACPACGAPWDRIEGWRPTCECPEHAPVPSLVLDPFAGSGTTLAAAKWLRRDYVGIELNPEYAKLIEKRLQPALEQEEKRQVFDYMATLPEDDGS